MRNNNEFVGQFKLIAMDDHFSYEGNGEKNEISYSRVIKVVEDKQYLYIFLGSVSALIIPPCTFLSENQRLSFFNLLQQKCTQAVFVKGWVLFFW